MTLTPGTSLLNFRLAEKIGEGGMGEVWKATDTTLGWPLIFGWPPEFDVSPDEKRFVIVGSQDVAKDLGGILIKENWTNEIGK